MGKRNKQKNVLMREWPEDPAYGVPPEDLISPIKKIILQGYRMERLPISQFTYTGYNIGKSEYLYSPTPSERFSARWLSNDTKFKRSLLDNTLITVFQLGMEQGRRLDRYNQFNNQLLVDIIDARTRTVNILRAKLAEYEEEKEHNHLNLESKDDELFIESLQEEELDTVDI